MMANEKGISSGFQLRPRETTHSASRQSLSDGVLKRRQMRQRYCNDAEPEPSPAPPIRSTVAGLPARYQLQAAIRLNEVHFFIPVAVCVKLVAHRAGET